MRYVFILLAVAGIIVSGMALHEHYREEGQAPCSINDKWDCGIVNKSEYAVIANIPVAAIGIVGYILLGVLGAMRWYRLMALCLLGALGFSAYLTYIEARVLGVYCILCVISACIVVTWLVLALITIGVNVARDRRVAAA